MEPHTEITSNGNKPSLLDQSISIISLSDRAIRSLNDRKIYLFSDLLLLTQEELLTLPNMGRKDLRQIQRWLARYGLALTRKPEHLS